MKQNNKLDIIYEDKEVIVINKKTNQLTIQTDKKEENTLYHQVRLYLNKKKEKVFIVHRLDKDTSGIIIFAKNVIVKEKLQKEFENREVIRLYEARVKEKLDSNYSKLVKQYLLYNPKCGLSFVTKNKKLGKEAITKVDFDSYYQENTNLKIEIFTGRQNQIRVALKSLNLTLLGDKKYAFDKSNFMHLNAYYLEFKNKILKKNIFEITPKFLQNR